MDDLRAKSESPESTAVENVLQFESVSAGYVGTNVLWNLNLRIPKGSVVAMFGANGAGKTTALRAASGLVEVTSGSVYLDGVNLTKMRPRRRAQEGLCLIPERQGIYRSLTVLENLKLHLPPWRKAEEMEVALKAFPILGQRLHQIAGSLSGGEQQMLAVSRAYVSGPKVVLVDELSTGLAPLVVTRIYESLRDLAKGGTSLLIVEQHLSRALEMADFACIMRRGEISWFGPAQEIDESTVVANYLGSSALEESKPEDRNAKEDG